MTETHKKQVVDVRGVEKHFGDGPDRIHVLKQVNLQAYSGEILMLVGPSGCGKTTLLSAIAGGHIAAHAVAQKIRENT